MVRSSLEKKKGRRKGKGEQKEEKEKHGYALSYHLASSSGMTLLRFILTIIAKWSCTDVRNIMRGPISARSSSVLFLAAEAGNFYFILEVTEQYPELIQEINDLKQSIFHVAVSHRHKDIFSLLYKTGSSKDSIVALEDVHGNNMLHLAGICSNGSSSNIPGAATRMQQELLWFKEVESMLPYSLREKKNGCGHTPREEFTNHHKHLVTDGEKWLKETAAQLMVVATLLAGVSFAATITFAGGYNQDTGYPVLSKNKVFPYFIQCISLAFIFSSASFVNVLSLLTSRYTEEDFAILLPFRLMLGMLTLLLSILSMIAAFILNFTLITEKKIKPLPNIPYLYAFVALLFSLTQFLNVIMYLFDTTMISARYALRYNPSSLRMYI